MLKQELYVYFINNHFIILMKISIVQTMPINSRFLLEQRLFWGRTWFTWTCSTFYMKPVKENQTFQTREVNSLPAVRWKRHVQTLLTFEVENRLFLYPLLWNVQFCLVNTVFKPTDLQTSLTNIWVDSILRTRSSCHDNGYNNNF